jgi:hypothetical protein
MTRYEETTALGLLLNHDHSMLPVGMIEIDNEIFDQMSFDKPGTYGLEPGGYIDKEGKFQITELSIVKLKTEQHVGINREEC